MPLHVKRERWRGFNQAQMLAQDLSGELGWVYEENILTRVRDTKSQMKMRRRERLNNMLGAFKIGKNVDSIEGKDVVLLDDVWTTGATLRECAKVLKREKSGRVWGLVVAR